jgi:hypothetical protein
VRVEKAGLRRAATLKAAKLLGSIVREGTAKLSKATVNATKTKMSQAFERVIGIGNYGHGPGKVFFQVGRIF